MNFECLVMHDSSYITSSEDERKFSVPIKSRVRVQLMTDGFKMQVHLKAV